MKKLGLIGGTGPESTLIYYKKIVYGAKEMSGKDFFPNINIDSVNVFDILNFCSQSDYNSLTEYLMKSIHNLIRAECEIIALTGNTPHIVFEKLCERSAVPLISMVDATRDKAVEQNIKRAGLLGTAFTMVEDFFRKPFIEAGIDIFIPDEDGIRFLSEKIASELEVGIVNPATQKKILEIINEMQRQHNIEAIILGCTELPLLFSNQPVPLPCLDTLSIHTEALLSAMNTHC